MDLENQRDNLLTLKNISITKLKRTGFNDFTHFDTAIKNTYKYYSKLKNK